MTSFNKLDRTHPFKKTLLALITLFIMTSPGYAYDQSKFRQVDPSMVCMTNNRDMGKEQISVQIGDKTYYGCCKMCAKTLAKNADSRHAVDPVTGSKVDKAKAIIGALPGGEVYYFESEESFKAFQADKLQEKR